VKFTAARLLCWFVLLVGSRAAWAGEVPSTQAERTVFLLGKLSETEQLSFTTALAGGRHSGVLLAYSTESARYLKAFLEKFQPFAVVPVGTFAEDQHSLEKKLGCKVEPMQKEKENNIQVVSQNLFSRAKRVVLSPDRPRRLLLQAASLAGALQAPLVIYRGEAGEKETVQKRLGQWQSQEIFAVGETTSLVNHQEGWRIHNLPGEEAVVDCLLRHRLQQGPIKTFVVANAEDSNKGNMAVWAPWIAGQKEALLVVTDGAGTNVNQLVDHALGRPGLAKVDSVILLGNLQALPMEKRANPLPGKDRYIEMEPLTPKGNEPFTFAVGRIFHEDPAVVTLMLARPRLFTKVTGRPQALVVSNPGGGLPLLETFSRNTAQELRNAGYQVHGFFGNEANRPDVRHLLPEQTIFLWEGHHSTLIRDYEAHAWPEPMQPSLVFLQSCLALVEDEAQPFLRRGAVGVIGTSTRTYSGTGGALSLAYFDALLYDKQTLGGGLRQAKNFLLAFAQLKEKRLGESPLTGANMRSAWAFSLWGDPTLHLPRPPLPGNALPGVRHRVQGKTLVVTLPDVGHDKVMTAKYQTQIQANVRLAGLFTRKDEGELHPLVPLLFAEVDLSGGPVGKTPRLRSRLPEQNWVFCWDARRGCGSLLVRPRSRDQGEIRFSIDWQEDAHGTDRSW
jgi:hypothetical protein